MYSEIVYGFRELYFRRTSLDYTMQEFKYFALNLNNSNTLLVNDEQLYRKEKVDGLYPTGNSQTLDGGS